MPQQTALAHAINADTIPHVTVHFPAQGRQLPALHGAPWIDLKIAQRLTAITEIEIAPRTLSLVPNTVLNALRQESGEYLVIII